MRVVRFESTQSLKVPARESQDAVFPNHVFHVERRPPVKLRRRGPRSLQAILRRQEHRFTALTVAPGESGAAPFVGAAVNAARLTSHFPCPVATLEHDSRRLRVNQLPVSLPCVQPSVFLRENTCLERELLQTLEAKG